MVRSTAVIDALGCGDDDGRLSSCSAGRRRMVLWGRRIVALKPSLRKERGMDGQGRRLRLALTAAMFEEEAAFGSRRKRICLPL